LVGGVQADGADGRDAGGARLHLPHGQAAGVPQGEELQARPGRTSILSQSCGSGYPFQFSNYLSQS